MCRPYGFGNHADMTETPLRPITNSGIWIPMLAPTCSTMISSDEPRCRGFNQSRIQFPLLIGMLLARDLIVGIQYLVQSRYRQVSLLVPTIESRASNIPIDKGNCIRGCLNPRHRGSSDQIIEEHVGANMGIQIPLLVITREPSRSCLRVSRTRRVYTLKVR